MANVIIKEFQKKTKFQIFLDKKRFLEDIALCVIQFHYCVFFKSKQKVRVNPGKSKGAIA